MDTDAIRTYESVSTLLAHRQMSADFPEINHLVDLKQKQANIDEAISARLQAEDTARQGTVILVFTIVTIVFVSNFRI
jgi:hypothetical protein